jgi:hypothetical protein
MHTMPAPTSPWNRLLRPGAIMMALGAVLVLAGIVQTTSSHFNGGNQSCPQGTSLIAKFNNDDHPYAFDSPAGNEHVVTLSHTSDQGAWWSSTTPISAIIVKGGSSSVLYSIAPPQVTGSFSNSGLPNAGNSHHPPAISNVEFCGSNIPAGTTTTAQSTSTSSSTTSSTSTSQPTSTTCAECQTTTTHVPSTTCDCTTTTNHPPTTCKCSTTTTHPQETTTTHGEASTTTVAETTTSQVSGSTLYVTTTTTHHGTTSTTTKSVAGSTVAGQGTSTSFGPTVSSTSVFTGDGGSNLPFTGSSSTPLVALGVVLLATGLTLTLSQARRRERTQS